VASSLVERADVCGWRSEEEEEEEEREREGELEFCCYMPRDLYDRMCRRRLSITDSPDFWVVLWPTAFQRYIPFL